MLFCTLLCRYSKSLPWFIFWPCSLSWQWHFYCYQHVDQQFVDYKRRIMIARFRHEMFLPSILAVKGPVFSNRITRKRCRQNCNPTLMFAVATRFMQLSNTSNSVNSKFKGFKILKYSCLEVTTSNILAVSKRMWSRQPVPGFCSIVYSLIYFSKVLAILLAEHHALSA